MRNRLLFPFLLFALSFGIFSQENIRFSHIKKGLSQLTVTCITQDKQGFMWFGTQDGLNQYDGIQVRKIFKNQPRNPNSISDNLITCLDVDIDGNIWIGTSKGGLNKYSPKTEKFSCYKQEEDNPNSLSSNRINSLHIDDENNIWVGTGNGLDVLRNNSISHYLGLNSGDGNNIISVLCKKNGSIFFAHQNFIGELIVASGEIKKYSLKGDSVATKITEAKTGDGKFAVVSTYNSGVFIFDFLNKKFANDFPKVYSEIVNVSKKTFCNNIALINGCYWFTLPYGGAFYFEDNIAFNYRNSNGEGAIQGNRLNSLFIDYNDNVWIGTDDGVHYYLKKDVQFDLIPETKLSIKEDNSSDIMGITHLKNRNKMCFVTDGNGIFFYDLVTKIKINIKPPGSGSFLSCLYLNEYLLLGSWGNGLYKYNSDSQRIDNFSFKNSTLLDGNILSIASLSYDELFLATLNGLYSFNPNALTFTKYSVNNGLSSNEIFCIVVDSLNNKLWIGTNGGGVNIMDLRNRKISVIKKTENDTVSSLASNTVNHIYVDGKNNFAWFATDNGLSRYSLSDSSFVSFYDSDGLSNNYIYCVIPDSHGNIWMSTNSGISRFNPNVENVDGSAFKNFDEADGVQGMEFIQGAFCKTDDGTIWMAGTAGVNYFNPDKQVTSNLSPLVYITSLIVNNMDYKSDSSLLFKKRIEFDYRSDLALKFAFTAVDYPSTGKIKYSYILEGYDKDWSLLASTSNPEYKKLSPGEYVFKVKAFNRDGVWSETPASITIVIYPPWWRTQLAYAAYIILGIGLFIVIPQYRTHRISRQNKLLEKKVEERTRQLAEKNADITSSIEYAKRIQQAILPTNDEIKRHFPNSFILYKPRDIVSGDFYWFGIKNGYKVFAVVDCTGHGVPGAFMSMIGHNLLNQIVNENSIFKPDEILNELHRGIQAVLKQGTAQSETTDGMDLAVFAIGADNKTLMFAGANRPLYLFTNNMLKKINPDKFPVGGAQFMSDRKFSLQTFQIYQGDMIYLFTDGYADQFGGENGKKFMMKNLNELLLSIHTLPVTEQSNELFSAFQQWKGDLQQVDDVLLAGFKV